MTIQVKNGPVGNGNEEVLQNSRNSLTIRCDLVSYWGQPLFGSFIPLWKIQSAYSKPYQQSETKGKDISYSQKPKHDNSNIKKKYIYIYIYIYIYMNSLHPHS